MKPPVYRSAADRVGIAASGVCAVHCLFVLADLADPGPVALKLAGLSEADTPVARHNFAQAVSALAWSPNDQTLAVAGADGALSVLQVQRK